jgi:hypothetical protein
MAKFFESKASALLVRDVLELARQELSKTLPTKSRDQLQDELRFTSAKQGDLKLLIKFHLTSELSPVNCYVLNRVNIFKTC